MTTDWIFGDEVKVSTTIKSFGNEKEKKRQRTSNAQGRSGAVEVSPHKIRLRPFFPPEQCSC